MDVTNAFNSIFNLILNGIGFYFETLDSITFRGVSLLDFMITLFVLGVALPLVIATVKNPRLPSVKSHRRSKENADD